MLATGDRSSERRPRADGRSEPHSSRSAVAGSTRAARTAGTRHATPETATRSAAAAANTSGRGQEIQTGSGSPGAEVGRGTAAVKDRVLGLRVVVSGRSGRVERVRGAETGRR